MKLLIDNNSNVNVSINFYYDICHTKEGDNFITLWHVKLLFNEKKNIL